MSRFSRHDPRASLLLGASICVSLCRSNAGLRSRVEGIGTECDWGICELWKDDGGRRSRTRVVGKDSSGATVADVKGLISRAVVDEADRGGPSGDGDVLKDFSRKAAGVLLVSTSIDLALPFALTEAFPASALSFAYASGPVCPATAPDPPVDGAAARCRGEGAMMPAGALVLRAALLDSSDRSPSRFAPLQLPPIFNPSNPFPK